MTLLGCVAAILVPMPFIFYFMGRKIRAKSKFAPAPDIEQDKKRNGDEESQVADEKDSNGSNGTNVETNNGEPGDKEKKKD